MRSCVLFVALTGCAPTHRLIAPDGGAPDAGPALLQCDPQFGHTFVFTAYGLLPPGQGFDLNGDGVVDNRLGVLAPYANPPWAASLKKSGGSMFLLDVTSLPVPVADTGAIGLSLLPGVDARNPPDATIALSGQGRFLVSAAELDVNCNPSTPFNQPRIQSQVLTASTDRFPLVLQSVGTIESSNCHIEATLVADGSGISTGKLGAVAPLCSVSKVSSPFGNAGDTLLDNVVTLFGLQPDFALAGHGLDQVVTDSTRVVRCILPDKTAIEGHSCVCDPRVTSQYSLGLFFTATTATIVGLAGRETQLP